MDRAYALLEIKAFDDEQRVIRGMATTPTPDRDGDIVDPFGVKYTNPLPFCLHHDRKLPVGQVSFGAPTAKGIEFEARIPKVLEAGVVRDRVDEAWHSAKYGLLRGVSIGFRAKKFERRGDREDGYLLKEIEVLELSMVTVPANAQTTITHIKSLDAPYLAATGTGHGAASSHSPGVTGPAPKKAAMSAQLNVSDRIKSLQTTLQTKTNRMQELGKIELEDGLQLDDKQQEEFDTLTRETQDLGKQLDRLQALEAAEQRLASPLPRVATLEDGAKARGTFGSRVEVKSNLPPGIEFARGVICKLAAYKMGVSAVELAKQHYPDNPRLQTWLKGAVASALTSSASYLGNMVQPTPATDFIEWLRPQTIIGKFGMTVNGVTYPSLNNVPFNARQIAQTSGATAYWVGEGKPKPVTSFGTDVSSLPPAKVATIAVLSDEIVRFSNPSAEERVRRELGRAVIERIDRTLVDPGIDAVSNVRPASLTNDLSPGAVTGDTADHLRADIGNLLKTFIAANIDPTNAVIIMPTTLALQISLMVNALGQPEFSGLTMRGGTLLGIPVITSQYAFSTVSPEDPVVVIVNADEVYVADDGDVDIAVSREATIEMSDDPENESGTLVNMFQNNSLAVRAERFLNFAKRRAAAAAYLEGANWGG